MLKSRHLDDGPSQAHVIKYTRWHDGSASAINTMAYHGLGKTKPDIFVSTYLKYLSLAFFDILMRAAHC